LIAAKRPGDAKATWLETIAGSISRRISLRISRISRMARSARVQRKLFLRLGDFRSAQSIEQEGREDREELEFFPTFPAFLLKPTACCIEL
jgi:hypothetical protein